MTSQPIAKFIKKPYNCYKGRRKVILNSLYMSISQCKNALSPLLMHLRYCSIALCHQSVLFMVISIAGRLERNAFIPQKGPISRVFGPLCSMCKIAPGSSIFSGNLIGCTARSIWDLFRDAVIDHKDVFVFTWEMFFGVTKCFSERNSTTRHNYLTLKHYAKNNWNVSNDGNCRTTVVNNEALIGEENIQSLKKKYASFRYIALFNLNLVYIINIYDNSVDILDQHTSLGIIFGN